MGAGSWGTPGRRGPGGAAGGDPALLPGESRLGAEHRDGRLVLPHRTAPPLRSPAAGRGLWAGRGPQGRGVPQAACKGRGLSLRCSRVTAPPRGSDPGAPPSRQPHGGPVSRPRARTKPQDRSVASKGRGVGGEAAEAVWPPAFQGRADAEGTPALGVLTGAPADAPHPLASQPAPAPARELAPAPPAPRRGSSQGLSPSSQGRRLPARIGLQRRKSFAPSLLLLRSGHFLKADRSGS